MLGAGCVLLDFGSRGRRQRAREAMAFTSPGTQEERRNELAVALRALCGAGSAGLTFGAHWPWP